MSFGDRIRSGGFDVLVACDCRRGGIGGCRRQTSHGDPDDDTPPDQREPPRSGRRFASGRHLARIFQEKKLRAGRCSGEKTLSWELEQG